MAQPPARVECYSDTSFTSTACRRTRATRRASAARWRPAGIRGTGSSCCGASARSTSTPSGRVGIHASCKYRTPFNSARIRIQDWTLRLMQRGATAPWRCCARTSATGGACCLRARGPRIGRTDQDCRRMRACMHAEGVGCGAVPAKHRSRMRRAPAAGCVHAFEHCVLAHSFVRPAGCKIHHATPLQLPMCEYALCRDGPWHIGDLQDGPRRQKRHALACVCECGVATLARHNL